MTADDFGAAIPVNQAIEKAHRSGVLTAASLMVAGEAATDAVARARAMPSLGVGLHLVLTRGRPALDPGEIPALVDESGAFAGDLFRAGVNFFFSPAARAQLAAEIRAQFEKFHATGLALDHLNGHNHIHLHPTVLGLALRIGRDYGLAAVRVPYEPPVASYLAVREGLGRRLLPGIGLWPWAALLKSRLRRAGVACNDRVFGLYDSGRMTASRFAAFLARLPAGVTEIYFHPATGRFAGDGHAADYDGAAELAALTDPGALRLIRERAIVPGPFAALRRRAAA